MTDKENSFYESRSFWESWMVYSFIISPTITATIFIVLSIYTKTEIPLPVYLISWGCLTLLISFVVAKFTIRKYFFYEDRVETIYPNNPKNFLGKYKEVIYYKDMEEAYFYKYNSAKLSSMLVIKLFDHKRKTFVNISRESDALFVLSELKKRKVNASLKVRSIYSK
jgi:hypothetical protein